MGSERLSANQEVFFPWSVNPLPSIAREFAGKALETARGNLGRLKGRRLPFLKENSGRPSSRSEDSGSQVRKTYGEILIMHSKLRCSALVTSLRFQPGIIRSPRVP